MPHLIIEYTTNLKKETDIPALLKKVNDSLLSHSDIIPIGGLRTRAIELVDYCVADGTEDDAFVHATLKLGSGRTEEDKKALCDDLFLTIKDHFADIYKKRYLALSLELHELTNPTYKHNNIHSRYKK
ncbi:5-carboxymethyl-2-hydroxymuconate isomerase [Oceanobacillus oncorhynchi subsp. incaldanensis]|uniref:5-carboxymethyl-2-hydroxymuconate Delta-isomerase n=1 Tax=Oceanobacillus aidingensis TaxID=645964 RepID=A0ABV9K2Q7_9BACI|nr:5-carboxymethyl-2-hydroxymuconate Delta-isomerase [Oceanobacillus oncorhynchi]MDM8099788.1 5-carboxymethyl-2-hydroxymuconate Delta-isomerase [Oceanobacillus oncorhynchi]GIO20427.1 5-carboxymethyl-2-hydroxymuconate isomerase [Oceanobacillus oncorhynchi subsp. incaldanensis]